MKNILMPLIVALFAFWNLPSRAEPMFGRYYGVLRHESRPNDQLARLDFVTEQEANGVIKLRATLVLYFGDFSSDEYASYDYHNVQYNLLTGTLVFDSNERELHFIVNNFRPGTIEAELKTGSGVVGKLMLKQSGSVNVERPLIQPIWGEFRGICDGIGQRLQMQSSPARPIATNRSDPFVPFIILTQRGDNGGAGCPVGTSTCVTNMYYDADYDFFKGHMDFHGKYGTLSCDVDHEGLTCGSCRFNRSSRENVGKGEKLWATSTPEWVLSSRPEAPGGSIQGVYSGFVHVEARDVYLPMSLAVTTYQGTPEGSTDQGLMVSVVSRLSFGGHTVTDESINTKFDPRQMNIMNAQPIFDRADHSTDMILKINKIGEGVVEGIWFSRRFGRVGQLYLSTNSAVELLKPEKLNLPLDGSFSDGALTVLTNVAMSDRAINSQDPFSPLTIEGNAWLVGVTTKKPFFDSAYDPFTGKFALSITDEGVIIGKRTETGIRIKSPNGGIMRPMQPHLPIELMEVSP